MRRLVAFLTLLLLAASLVAGHAPVEHVANPGEDVEQDDLPHVFEQFEGSTLPQPFKGLYGDERVNFYLQNGDVLGHAVTEDGAFASAGTTAVDNPSLEVRIDSLDVVEQIATSEAPLDTYYQLKDEEQIDVEPVGFGAAVKWGVTETVGKVASWFI